jgi:hypothetical protein
MLCVAAILTWCPLAKGFHLFIGINLSQVITCNLFVAKSPPDLYALIIYRLVANC